MYLGSRYSGNSEVQTQKWLIYLPTVLFTIFLLKQPSGLAIYMLVVPYFSCCQCCSGLAIFIKEKKVKTA